LNESVDRKLIENVKDICASLGRAVSATKIFPAGHESIAQLRIGAFARLQKFLDAHAELELDVRQDTFLFLDEIVRQEEHLLRGLPFFFHKDGMQKLAFLRGLTSEEFSAFLDLVRDISFLPMEKADIVDALWQRDFEHIRFLAPDEFIEAKIAGSQDLAHEFEIRREALYTGVLEFTAEDAEEIFRRSMALGRQAPGKSDEGGDLIDPLTENDAHVLEAVIAAERRETVENEFPEMIFEILNLEDRPEEFAQILSSLEPHFYDLARKLDFAMSVLFLGKLDGLAGVDPDSAEWKKRKIEQFYDRVRSRFPMDKIRERALEKGIPNARTFFEYLKFVGPAALSLTAGLYEHIRDLEFRVEARAYLEDMGRRDPRALSEAADPDKPEFTKAVIAQFGQGRDAATIPLLGTFITTGRKDVKLEAVRVLGIFPEAEAQERLAALLQDPDEELRIAALKSIAVEVGGTVARRLREIASEPDIRRKTFKEKEAVFRALARSRSDEVCDLFHGLIKRSSLWGRAKTLETRICAVRALATMATPAALVALKTQVRRGPVFLRKEIQAALKGLAFGPDSVPRRLP